MSSEQILGPRRSDAKYGELADSLRRAIVQGHWAPGAQLPTWDALCARHKVGRPTLTRALAMLKAEGFVSADATRGTFVTARPPHLNRYLLLFPSAPGRQGAGGWNLYWDTLTLQALASEAHGGPRIEVRFDVSPHPDCDPYAQLVADVERHRVAGVLVASGGDLSALRLPAGTAHVHVCGGVPDEHVPSVGVDWQSFHEQAARAMFEQGCRRVAILAGGEPTGSAVADLLARHGIAVPERWRLNMPGNYAPYARNLVRLLLAGPKHEERPDGLVIMDDNLVPAALAGVVDEGVSVPRELRIVAHCNWPGPPPPPLPVLRLGFAADAVLKAGLEILRRQQHPAQRPANAAPPRLEHIAIPAIREPCELASVSAFSTTPMRAVRTAT